MQGLPDEAPSGQGLESRTEVLGGVESGGVRPCRKRSSDWGLGHELRVDHKSGWGLVERVKQVCNCSGALTTA